MKPNSMISMVAALALLAGVSSAQGQQPPGEPITQTKINLTLEQRHVIKEIIKDVKVQPAPASTETSVGAKVSESVPLNPMPTEVSEKVPQIKTHLFFLKDGRVVLVDPKDRTVVEAIE